MIFPFVGSLKKGKCYKTHQGEIENDWHLRYSVLLYTGQNIQDVPQLPNICFQRLKLKENKGVFFFKETVHLPNK